jgi:NADH-ubiquinone oxidoreductase chain 2
LYSRVTTTILIITSLITYDNLDFIFLNKGIGIFSGLFHSTSITNTFHIFIFSISSVILLLTSFHARKVWLNVFNSNPRLLFSRLILADRNSILNKGGEQYNIIEYSLIILFIVTGAVFLVSTSDLVSIFLSIELQSYGLYLLSTIYRDSEPATSGGIMYFLLGGLSSCFILLSTSLLYANSGTTNLDSLYIISTISNVNENNFTSLLYWYKSYYIHISLLFMSVGFLFKVSAAPFHFWSPDVYDGIPTIVTTFVAIIAKISIFIFLLELVHYTSKSMFDVNFSWTMTLLISSLLSLVIGTVAGLAQSRIKRLYAFSTVSHVGFILLALSITSIESTQAFMFYIMQYSISNLNAFMLIIAIGYFLYCYEQKENPNLNKDESNDNLKDINNSPIQLIDQLKGYYYINPFLALSLAITLFSFAGIPPLLGFFGKQMVLSAAIDSGYIFMSLVAILTSVISAVYYLAIIKQMFFDKPEITIKNSWMSGKKASIMKKLFAEKRWNVFNEVIVLGKNIVISSSLSLPVSIITLIISLFIFMPQEWLSLANLLAFILFSI